MIYAIIVKKLKGRQKEKYMGMYIYWLILFGITEYIIYISFISSITKQVDDDAYIKDKMYMFKIKRDYIIRYKTYNNRTILYL